MKRFLFMSALASVALASCVNDEAMENTSKASDQKITFNAPIVSGTTRVVYGEQPQGTDMKYSTSENFRVYAFWSKDQLKNQSWVANGEEAKLYMNNVEVAHADGDWAPEHVSGGNVYYWPKVGYLTFAAYSPSDVSNFNPTYDKDGLKINNFKVNSEVTKQYDLMFSNRSYDRTASENLLDHVNDVHTGKSYNGVDILFKHALSSIKFKVKAAGEYTGTTIKITGITILNAYYQGNFAENYNETNDNNDDAKWTIISTPDVAEYAVWTGDQTVDSGTAQNLNDISDVILLPQLMKHDTSDPSKSVAVKVNYTITNSESVTLQQEAILYLDDQDNNGVNDDYYTDGTNAIPAWEMGKRYTYTINIGLNTIFFSPEVEYWDDVTVTPDLTI